MILLYTSGYFVDWQELVVEPFFLMRGLKLYTDIGTHHTPLLTQFLGLLYKLVGTEVMVRKILLVLVSAAAAFLTIRAAHRLAGKKAALFSVLLFIILWPFYGGRDFWFDTFLSFFYIFVFVLILKRKTPLWLALAGIIMGLSFLIKQNGAIVAAVVFLMLLAREKPFRSRLRGSLFFSAGFLVPVLITATWYAFRGQLADAYYWIIKYNLSGSYLKWALKPPPVSDLLRLLVAVSPLMVLLALCVISRNRRKRISWEFRLAFYMGLGASLAVYPRWERFHVAPSLPFLVICLVLSFNILLMREDKRRENQRSNVARAMLSAWAVVVFLDIGLFFPPLLADRIIPGFSAHWPLRSYNAPSWYDESYWKYIHHMPRIGRRLNQKTDRQDRIFVWGWLGSRIYLEADRLPAGTFYYALPWFAYLPRFREDLSIVFEKERPCFVIEARKRFQYPETPTLNELGVNLKKHGYQRFKEWEDRYPEFRVWKLTHD